jgi:hypothetical protein
MVRLRGRAYHAFLPAIMGTPATEMAKLLRPVRVAPLARRLELHDYAISPRDAPEFLQKNLALLDQRAQRYPEKGAAPPQEGGGECRTLGASAAACALVESTRVSHHGHTGITRHSPRNGFTTYSALSSGTGLVAPVVSGISSTNLTPASGRQDHTTSPSARVRSRLWRTSRPSHPAPNVRDDRETPLMRVRDGK